MQDEIYKKLFAFPRMVEDLMRGFAAREWAAAIDFSTLRKLPTEFVSDDLLKRRGDTVWVARFHDGRHLLMVLEFQSRDDPGMALRILAYTSLLYQELLRNEAPVLDPGRRLPLVLPVVLYNGETPWKATNRLAALIQPAERALAPYQPSQLHYVLDERHAAEDDFPRQNLVTAMLRVERVDSPSDLIVALDVLRERFRRPEDADLRRAFTDWVRRIAQRLVPGGEKLAAQMTLEDMRMSVVERVGEWPKQWVREGREQGMREGLRQGIEKGIEQGIERGRAEERALLRRMTASRFGAEAAERLAAALVEVADPERLCEIGEWLVCCETAEELLARVNSVRAGG